MLREVNSLKEQLSWFAERAKENDLDPEIQTMADEIEKQLTTYQNKLNQTKNQSGQDPIRFPPRIDNQYLELYKFATGPDGYISGGAEGRPLESAYTRSADLNTEWVELKKEYLEIINTYIPAFNDAIQGGDIRALTKPKRD